MLDTQKAREAEEDMDGPAESGLRASLFSLLPWKSGISAVLKKDTLIRLRWPFVIMCSCLLIYASKERTASIEIQALLLFYLMSNATLYFFDERLFRSPYFYVPLIVLDTVFLITSIALSGQTSPDFYLACFVTMFLCCICSDFRGLLVVTVLAPFLYGSYLFQSSQLNDPSSFLRLPFPFVIALFYGYFAQVERSERTLKEKVRNERERRRAAEKLSRQRECQAALYQINLAITSSLDLQTVLDVLLEKVGVLLSFVTASSVKLVDEKEGSLQTVASRHAAGKEWSREVWESDRDLANSVAATKAPLLVAGAQTDPRTRNSALFQGSGLVCYLGVPLIAKGRVLGVLALFLDRGHRFTNEEIDLLSALSSEAAVAIHNARLYELVKAQADELGQANKVKEEFLGVMSHELRTPLNVILGYSGMMEQGMFGDISPEQEKALQKINKQSSDLLAMMSGIMEATKVEAGAIVVEREEVDLRNLLAEMKSLYTVPVDKQFTLRWDYSGDLPLIYTDPVKLRHILLNLINNAIKFTNVGEVTIAARYAAESGNVEFRIADTGIGIPKESLPVIFGMFRQGESSDTQAKGGVGLGLYIVKKFTDLLDGRIEVESELGRGSTFTVSLPSGLPKYRKEKLFPLRASI